MSNQFNFNLLNPSLLDSDGDGVQVVHPAKSVTTADDHNPSLVFGDVGVKDSVHEELEPIEELESINAGLQYPQNDQAF